jgi:ATP-dependent HslUV protease ATP-binding subunit HslU
MIRDLLDQAISMIRSEQAKLVKEKAEVAAEDRLLDLLLPPAPSRSHAYADAGRTIAGSVPGAGAGGYVDTADSQERRSQTRDRLREQLRAGKLDAREVEITITDKPLTSMMLGGMGMDQMNPEMSEMLERMMPEQHRRRRVTVAEARRILSEQETDKLLDKEKITAEAIERTEQSGILFLDEIDKIASPSGDGGGRGPDVSRQGVQRDLLPIVEGSAVNTRYGVVHTDHILFIEAGAFHSTAVSDLMPELQGRFPIRVELSPLTRDDFVRILTEPGNALTKQQQELLGVEGIEVTFEEAAIGAIADYAAKANASLENIGARRLMTIVEKLFEQINFDAPERAARGETQVNVTAGFVKEQVGPIVADEDLSRFVL